VNVASINIGDAQQPLETLIRMSAVIRSFVRRNPADYVLVEKVDDIEAAKKAGKLAVTLDIEGAFAIADQLSLLELFYDLGVRWMAMVYNRKNLVGAGCHDDRDDGLTEVGRAFIAEMDRLGMVKCCSHTGYRTAMDVLSSTATPTIFSHSNPLALKKHPRNITDEMIDACAKTGGVVCLNGIGIFLGENDVRVSTFVDHIDYVVQRIGAGHTGIGLDYVLDQEGLHTLIDRAFIWPKEHGYGAGMKCMPPEEFPFITDELLRRRYSDDDVKAILGGNLMRVARQVWR